MSGEYRDRAAECWRLAAETASPEHRASLMEMAQAWMRLHDQALRNAKSDLSYETPLRGEPAFQHHHHQQQQQRQPEVPSGKEPEA